MKFHNLLNSFEDPFYVYGWSVLMCTFIGDVV